MPFRQGFDHPGGEVLTSDAGVALFVRAVQSLRVRGSVKRHLQPETTPAGIRQGFKIGEAAGVERAGRGMFGRLRAAAVRRRADGRCRGRSCRGRRRRRNSSSPLTTGIVWRAGQVSDTPSESGRLRVLVQVNQDLLHAIGRRCAEQKIATVDPDATAIGSFKREAKPAFEEVNGISRFWRCGRRLSWRWGTSSRAATCRRLWSGCWRRGGSSLRCLGA